MFSPVSMERLSAVVLKRDERTVLRGLGREAAVHLVRTEAGPETAPQEPRDRSDDLGRCDALLGRISSLVRRLDVEELPEPASEMSELSIQEIEGRLAAAEDQAAGLTDRLETVQGQWGQVTSLLDQVSAYEGLALPIEQLEKLSFLHFATGRLPSEHVTRLCDEVGDNVVLLPLSEEGEEQTLIAVTSRKGRFALETALEGAGFRHESIKPPEAETEGGMDRVAEEAKAEQERLGRELKTLRRRLEGLGDELAPELANLRAAVLVERKILEAEQNFPHTDQTVLVTGWVPEDEVPGVRRFLNDLTGGRCVVEAEGADDVPEDQVPVLLRHRRLLRPFELLVAGYGLPGYRELEPTLFVGFTFLVMFGMMFGDVGHGAVLILGGLAGLRFARSQKGSDAGVLLIFAGTASVLFGLVYGSYFGFEPHGWALWHGPLEPQDTLLFMGMAMTLGLGIISLGLVLNIVNRLRRGDVVGGILDRFGVVGGVLYWAAVVLVFRALIQGRSDLNWLLLPLIGLAVLALLVKEPILYAISTRTGGHHHATSFPMAVMESLIEVFETGISYMANTISFVRLAAYAMSHAAILLATFLVADEVSRATGQFGGVIGVVVIIVGNVVTILLEGVIASVQALRLEYYEFFSKFFSGRGRAFEPFRLSAKDGKTSG